MFGFLNQRSRVCALMQVLNAAVFLVAINEMMDDPEHAWEWGLEAVTHFLSLLALVERPAPVATASSISFNFMRLGAIYCGVTSGASVLSSLTNLLDAAAHLGNIVVPVATAERKSVPVPQATM